MGLEGGAVLEDGDGSDVGKGLGGNDVSLVGMVVAAVVTFQRLDLH